jgi:hypothetical protein
MSTFSTFSVSFEIVTDFKLVPLKESKKACAEFRLATFLSLTNLSPRCISRMGSRSLASQAYLTKTVAELAIFKAYLQKSINYVGSTSI